jgi:hypothetical protein
MRDLSDRETAPRLAHGGRIDRTRPLTFTFDGRTLTGFAGDTLASAPATRWPPRCWPTASIWSADRSRCTVRAASSATGRTSPTP